MLTVLDIILPVFGLVLIGYLSGKFKVINDSGITGLSTFVFSIAIPVLLFHSAATTEFPNEIPWNYVFAYYVTTILLFGFSILAGRLLGLKATESSIFAMSGAYPNVVMLGIPLVLTSLGETATLPLFIIISTHAAVMFSISTFAAEASLGHTEQLHRLPLQTLKVLLNNPIFVGLISGLLLNIAGFELPSAIERTAAYLASAALPCVVYCIGASISRYKISGGVTNLTAALLIKNLLHPFLVWFACTKIFAVEPEWTVVAVILAACPSGINVYLFANRYQVIIPATATVIILSTALSVPVLSTILILLIP